MRTYCVYVFICIFAKYDIYTDYVFSIHFCTFLFDKYMLARVRQETEQAYCETRVALSARIVLNAKPMFRYGHGRYYRAYN